MAKSERTVSITPRESSHTQIPKEELTPIDRQYLAPLEDFLSGGRGDLSTSVLEDGLKNRNVYETLITPQVLQKFPNDPEAAAKLLEERTRHPYIIGQLSIFTSASYELALDHNIRTAIQLAPVNDRIVPVWNIILVGDKREIITPTPELIQHLVVKKDAFSLHYDQTQNLPAVRYNSPFVQEHPHAA